MAHSLPLKEENKLRGDKALYDIYQKTIGKEIEIKGIGLHSGLPVSLKLIPAEENTGIVFIKNGLSIPAHIDFANSFEFSTSLYKDGQWVKTVEHLMASLFFLEIDNLYIKIDSEEVPILDGSSKVFIEEIKKAGIKNLKEEKNIAVLTKKVEVSIDDRYIIAKPYEGFKASYQAVYENSIIGKKKAVYIHKKHPYIDEIPEARTYCFLEEVEFLKSKGLAKGGSLENAVVIDGKNNQILNKEGFRFENEPVKHKVLDLIGDLYLLGFPLMGEVYSYKGGHRLNALLVKELINQNAFELLPASDTKQKPAYKNLF